VGVWDQNPLRQSTESLPAITQTVALTVRLHRPSPDEVAGGFNQH